MLDRSNALQSCPFVPTDCREAKITALHFVLCVEDVFGEPRGNGIELEEQIQCGVESKIKSKIEYAYNTMRW